MDASTMAPWACSVVHSFPYLSSTPDFWLSNIDTRDGAYHWFGVSYPRPGTYATIVVSLTNCIPDHGFPADTSPSAAKNFEEFKDSLVRDRNAAAIQAGLPQHTRQPSAFTPQTLFARRHLLNECPLPMQLKQRIQFCAMCCSTPTRLAERRPGNVRQSPSGTPHAA